MQSQQTSNYRKRKIKNTAMPSRVRLWKVTMCILETLITDQEQDRESIMIYDLILIQMVKTGVRTSQSGVTSSCNVGTKASPLLFSWNFWHLAVRPPYFQTGLSFAVWPSISFLNYSVSLSSNSHSPSLFPPFPSRDNLNLSWLVL